MKEGGRDLVQRVSGGPRAYDSIRLSESQGRVLRHGRYCCEDAAEGSAAMQDLPPTTRKSVNIHEPAGRSGMSPSWTTSPTCWDEDSRSASRVRCPRNEVCVPRTPEHVTAIRG